MGKSGAGLAAWANDILNAGTHVYWYGTYCNKCTNALLSGKTKQYASHYKESRTATYKKHIQQSKIATDCVGLIKGYYWEHGGVIKYKRDGLPDVNASGMYANSKIKGDIATIPEIPGLLVWVKDKSHVGVYLGNGAVGEARNFTNGVQRNALSDRNFVYWGTCPYVQYTDEETKLAMAAATSDVTNNMPAASSSALKKGSNGPSVKEMQELLIKAGYELPEYGADGSFGDETLTTLRRFQADNALVVDGIYGPKTKAKLTAYATKVITFTVEGVTGVSADGRVSVSVSASEATRLARLLAQYNA